MEGMEAEGVNITSPCGLSTESCHESFNQLLQITASALP